MDMGVTEKGFALGDADQMHFQYSMNARFENLIFE